MRDHGNVLEWLQRSRDWCTPLHYVEVLTTERTRRLLRGGADLHARAHAGASSPLELAQQLARAERPPPADAAAAAPERGSGGARPVAAHTEARPWALVLRAAEPWSGETHSLFPAAARSRAVELLRLGYLLASQPRFAGEAHALVDAWRGFVLPHAVSRECVVAET